MKKRNGLGLAALALMAAAIAVGTSAFAETNPGTPNAAAKHPAASPEAEAVADMALATELAAYGRKHKDALALITAARIFKGMSTTKMEAEPETHGPTDAKDDGKADSGLDAKTLLAQAGEYSGEDKALKALADRVASEASRGAWGGPKSGRYRVWGRCKNSFVVTFRAAQLARVSIAGSGNTDLDLYVYDAGGHLIAVDRRSGDRGSVAFCPRWTGKFRIEIHNLGSYTNVYSVWTN